MQLQQQLGICLLFSQANAVILVNSVYLLDTTPASSYAALDVQPLRQRFRLHKEVHVPDKPESRMAKSMKYVEG